MKVVTLIENETIKKELKAEHGLCFYIETKKHKILFDLGPNDEVMNNAKVLKIKLDAIDIVVISHGHIDHGGGLTSFLKLNTKAKVYISKHAFVKHMKMVGKKNIDIGLKQPKSMERFVLIDKDIVIDDEISIYSKVPYKQQVVSDSSLFTFEENHFVRDEFHHEVYLGVSENGKRALFTGCSHKGIEHIVDVVEKNNKIEFTHVLGGYHFSHYDPLNPVETDYLKSLGNKWKLRDQSQFYACHCTGERAFNVLKKAMDDNIKRLKTGNDVII